MQLAYDIVKIGLLLFAFAGLVDGFSRNKTGLLSKAGAFIGWSLALGMITGMLVSVSEGKLGLPGVWSWIAPIALSLGLAFGLDGKPINRFIIFFGGTTLVLGTAIGVVLRVASLEIEPPILVSGGMFVLCAVAATMLLKSKSTWLAPMAAVLCSYNLLSAARGWLYPAPERGASPDALEQFTNTMNILTLLILGICIGIAVYMERRNPKTSSVTSEA